MRDRGQGPEDVTQWKGAYLARKKLEFYLKYSINLAWERTPVIPELRRKQEFKVIPGYIGNSRTAWATRDPV